MGLLFPADFETGNTSQFTSATGTVGTAVVHNGVYAGVSTNNTNFTIQLSQEYGTIYTSAWYRWSEDLGNAWIVQNGYGAGTVQYSLRTTTSKNLRMYIPDFSTNPATGTITLEKDTWYQIETVFAVDNSGFYNVLVNGTLDIATRTDTKNGSDTGIKEVRFQGINAAGTCYIDDIAIRDDHLVSEKIGMFITKPGFDVLYEVNPKNMIFDSDFNHLKTAGYGTVNLSAAAGGTQVQTVNHSLGYQPLVLSYYRNTSTNPDRWMITTTIFPSTGISRVVTNDSVAAFAGTATVGFLYKNNAGSAGTVELLYEYFYEGN